MDKPPKDIVVNTIRELYKLLDLPLDHINAQSEFDIHPLSAVHKELPFQSPVFRTSYFSFVFVNDGQGNYTTDAQQFEFESCTIYFNNPGHYKSFTWNRLQEAYLVTLSETFLKENVHANIFEEFPFLLAETVPPTTLAPEVYDQFDQLCGQILTEYNTDSPYRNRIIGNLFVVILLKIKTYFWQDYNPIHEGNRSSRIVTSFKQLLEQHFRKLSRQEVSTMLRVQDCADALHLHPNYLSTVIKSKTGKSINAWITEKAIAEAKALLKNSSLSVKEIAYRMGFTESTNFGSFFKKQTGQSPAQYRKQHPSS